MKFLLTTLLLISSASSQAGSIATLSLKAETILTKALAGKGAWNKITNLERMKAKVILNDITSLQDDIVKINLGKNMIPSKGVTNKYPLNAFVEVVGRRRYDITIINKDFVLIENMVKHYDDMLRSIAGMRRVPSYDMSYTYKLNPRTVTFHFAEQNEEIIAVFIHRLRAQIEKNFERLPESMDSLL